MKHFSTKIRMGFGALLLLTGTSVASAEGAISLASATPADGTTVIDLKTITLTLNNANAKVGTEWTSGVKASVTNADGEQVATATGRDSNYGFRLSITPTLSEAGTYTINVPAKAMYTMDWDTNEPDESTYNEAFTLTYNVVEMEPVVIGETDPKSESILASLKQLPIEVTGGDPTYGIEWRAGVKGEISDFDTDEVMEQYATISYRYNGYRLNLNKELTTPGDYMITIPANALYAVDADMKEVYGTGNKETYLFYTIVDSPALTLEKSIPEDEATVAALESISLFWSGGDPSVGYGINEDIEITVTDDYDDIVSTCTIEPKDESKATGEYIVTLENPIEEDGTYYLDMPDGVLYALDEDGNRVNGNNSPYIFLEFTVDVSTGIANITVESEKEIYNLHGVQIKNGNIPAGVYIINGKKVMVK